MKICDCTELSVIILGGKHSDAYAATFVTFDDNDISKYNASHASIAYEALEDEYGGFEKNSGYTTIHECNMKFNDGSSITLRSI